MFWGGTAVERIERKLEHLHREVKKMAGELEALQAQAATNASLIDQIIAKFDALGAAQGIDPAAVAAVTQTIADADAKLQAKLP